MKKLVFLALSGFLSLGAFAQIDTVFYEDFDGATFQVTTTSLGTATNTWNDTNNLSVSGSTSYHGRVQAPAVGSNQAEVVFRTNAFSTLNYSFAFLDFYHIAKLYQANQGLIKISTDNGVTWTTLNNANSKYAGPSTNWGGGFQEASYSIPNQNINLWFAGSDPTPTNAWWVNEKFDITNLAIGGATGNGFAQVRIEFSCNFILNPATVPPNNRTFGAGWWVDNLLVTASTCEQFPPRFHFNYTPVPNCFPVRPTGGLTQEPSNSYRVGARVTDTVPNNNNPALEAGIDSVVVFYRKIDSTGVGPWQYETLNLVNAARFEYRATISNVLLGDTIEYFYKAWDLACPNITRFPDSLADPSNAYIKFWPQPGLPFKCGLPDCGSLPGVISSFPWLEDFEGPNWQGGTGSGDVGTQHRGQWPIDQTGPRYWNLQPPPNTAGFGWSVRVGQTGTPFTGPSGNHTPGGARYVYAEASQGNITNTTIFITPCIDLSNETRDLAFEFYYHAFGRDMGNLRVDIDTGTNNAAFLNAVSRVVGEQQSGLTDDWKKIVIPLKDYKGKFIRIRMLAIKRTTFSGPDARGDLAIDDLRIYEPVAKDAEVMEVVAPEPGKCDYTSTEEVKVILRNLGRDSITSLPLRIQVNGGAVQNETASVSLGTGDTVLYTLNSTVNLSTLGNYAVRVWSALPSDAVPDNDTAVSDSIYYTPSFSTFPLVLDFEGLPANSSQTGTSLFTTAPGLDPNYQWRVGAGYTPTRNTGPKYGYYKQGQYFYTEATGSTGKVNSYIVSSTCLDFTGMSNPTLDFYYYMRGANIEGLEVEIYDPLTMEPGDWLPLAGSTVAPSGQNHILDDYQFKRVNLSAYGNQGIRLRIVAKRTGNGDLGDIAIDKVMIYNRSASDAGAEFIMNAPEVFSLPSGTTTLPVAPSVVLRNFGTSNLTNLRATWTVEPLCGPNANQVTTYTSNTGVSIAPGNAATLSPANLNLQLEPGDCKICVYTTLAADNNNFNDTVCRIVVGAPEYEIPVFDDFDNCDYEEYGMFAQNPTGISTWGQWNKGEPPASSKFFQSNQTSNQIWATGLKEGYFVDGSEERLVMPFVFGFDTIVSPTIAFFQNVDMGSGAAGAVQIRIPGAWESLGASLGSFQGVGVNWYTGPFGTLSAPTSTIEQGFTGTSTSSRFPTGWAFSSFPMSQLNRATGSARMRFLFEANAGANSGQSRAGWAIDDFEIFIPPQNSVAPIDFFFTNPLQYPTFDQPITFRLENTGVKLLNDFRFKAEILPVGGGAPVWSSNWDTASAPPFAIIGTRFNRPLSEPWDGATVTTGQHTLRLITQRPNFKGDNLPVDDTLEVIVDVMPEYEFNLAAGDSVYCNDFEANNGALPFLALNSRIYRRGRWSWEKGTPVQFPGAFSGTQCWMTGLDSNYRSRDESSLFTPVFVIDTGTNYELSFVHRFETEKYHDGGTVEISTDGGQNWTTLGFANEDNWYNTEFVTALDIIKPGWTDTADWDSASYVLRFDTAVERAVIRFRFESDFSIQKKGWAIDDVCFKASAKNPTFVLGSKEYNPSPETMVGELSPNPTNDLTHLPIFTTTAKGARVEIYSVVGQRVFSKDYQLEMGSSRLLFETFDWKAGMYFVNIEIDGERLTRKLVVR